MLSSILRLFPQKIGKFLRFQLNNCLRLCFFTSSYVFEQQKSVVALDHDEFTDGEERYREEACLECVGGIQNRVILQPTSITSDIHAKMSLKISETFKKEQK